MNEIDRQTLSTLIDGETGSADLDRAIDRLLDDQSLRQDWERYHLIGRAIRRDSVDLDVRGLSDRLQREIQCEENAKVVPLQPRRRTESVGKQRFLRMVPLTSALAAGLAVVAVMLAPGGLVDLPESFPGSSQTGPQIASEAPRWQREDPDLRQKLDQLVVSHRENGGTGLPGYFSYASVVGQTAGY